MSSDFHATHSARFSAEDPDSCWFCGRERAKCKRKIWYANGVDAGRAATQREQGSAYECPWCGGWHVTTRKLVAAVPDGQ